MPKGMYKFDTRYKYVTIHGSKYKVIDSTTVMSMRCRELHPELSNAQCCMKNYNFSWDFIDRPWLGDNPVYSND